MFKTIHCFILFLLSLWGRESRKKWTMDTMCRPSTLYEGRSFLGSLLSRSASPHGVMANVLDSNLEVSLFEIQHASTFTFELITLGKVRGPLNKFPDFIRMVLLLIVHIWNSSPLRSNLLRLQCTCCTVPITSGRSHRSPLVSACQWPSSQPLSSPQLSHNDSLWAWGISKSHKEQCLDYRDGEELSWCPSWLNSLWQGWSCGLLHCPGGNATVPIWTVLASSQGISC